MESCLSHSVVAKIYRTYYAVARLTIYFELYAKGSQKDSKGELLLKKIRGELKWMHKQRHTTRALLQTNLHTTSHRI